MQQLVFITGGTGFLGCHLLVNLYKNGKKIRALVRHTSSFNQLREICKYYGISYEDLYNSIEWVYGDLMDYVGLCERLKNVYSVYHCAAIVSFSSTKRDEIINTNVRGTANIIDAAIECGVKELCFISSISSLGNEENGHFIDENSIRTSGKKTSSYSESKFRSELEVWRGKAEGLRILILNPGIIIGPGIPEKGSLLLFKAAKKGMLFYTEGKTGYVDVRDVCRAALELMERGAFGKRFVLVSDNVEYKQFISLISDEFGKRRPSIKANKCILSIAALFSESCALLCHKEPQITKETAYNALLSRQYSSERIIKEIGFEFIPVAESIKETCDFIKSL